MKKFILLLLIVLHSTAYSQEQPFMEITYNNLTLVNITTNTVETKREGAFNIVFYTHSFYLIEDGFVERYTIVDSRDDYSGVTMRLRNENNQKCGLKFEKDKLTIINMSTKKSIVLKNPYYHKDKESDSSQAYKIDYYLSFKVNKYDARYDIQDVFIQMEINLEDKYLIMKERGAEEHYKLAKIQYKDKFITFIMYNSKGYSGVAIDRDTYRFCIYFLNQDTLFLTTNR